MARKNLTQDDLTRAFDSGVFSYVDGLHESDCPFQQVDEAVQWFAGFCHAESLDRSRVA